MMMMMIRGGGFHNSAVGTVEGPLNRAKKVVNTVMYRYLAVSLVPFFFFGLWFLEGGMSWDEGVST